MTDQSLLALAKDTLLKSAQLQVRAIARARVVRGEIGRLREHLALVTPGKLASVAAAEDARTAALLASYDAEMTRLCVLPGVLDALLAEMASEPA